MQLKFDWLVVLENLRRGILVTDTLLDGPEGPRIVYANKAWYDMTGYTRDEIKGQTPRILQGPRTDKNVVTELRVRLLERKVFHGQTWNYRKNGEPFLMNWYCYAVYGDRPKPLYYVAEQEDVTEMERLRMQQRIAQNPFDPVAKAFFEVMQEFEQRKLKVRTRGI